MLCRPPGFSWLDFGGEATEDRREVNPGVLDNDTDGEAGGGGDGWGRQRERGVREVEEGRGAGVRKGEV